MRILHDVKNTLAVSAPSTEAVQKISQPILMQGSHQQQTHHHGCNDSQQMGQQHTAEPQCGSHRSTCEPTSQGPMFHSRLITLLRRLMQSPERQSGKEDKGCPNAVVPFRLINTYFHLVQKYFVIAAF